MPPRSLCCLLFLAGLTGCRIAHPSELPIGDTWLVAVKSARLADNGAWYKRFAHHAFIDIRRGSEAGWQRLESGAWFGILNSALTADEARLDSRFDGGNVRVLGWLEGPAAERAAAALAARAAELAQDHGSTYTAWPGPNSNTLVADLIAHTPELTAVLDPNCIGKDYPGWIDAGLTASKTGVRVDTVPLGLAVGLREGVELHFCQLTFGVSLDPPGLSLPFLPQIPWGFLPGADPVLRPPESLVAMRIPVDVAEAPARRVVAELDGDVTLAFTAPDQSAWTRVDVAFGAAITPKTRRFDFDFHPVSAKGLGNSSQGVPLMVAQTSQAMPFRCGPFAVCIWATRTADSRLRIEAAFARDAAALQPLAEAR